MYIVASWHVVLVLAVMYCQIAAVGDKAARCTSIEAILSDLRPALSRRGDFRSRTQRCAERIHCTATRSRGNLCAPRVSPRRSSVNFNGGGGCEIFHREETLVVRVAEQRCGRSRPATLFCCLAIQVIAWQWRVATDRRTNRQTEGHHYRIKTLLCGRGLNNMADDSIGGCHEKIWGQIVVLGLWQALIMGIWDFAQIIGGSWPLTPYRAPWTTDAR